MFFLFFLVFQIGNASAQETVSGKVVDDNNLPLPGVNVQIKGTSSGTITNMEGEFTIEANTDVILIFSFLGFETKEVNYQGQEDLSVILNENVGELDQVLVVGYGTVKKSDLTGSVASVGEDDFPAGAQSSAVNLLQGKAAGVQVTQADSKPGGGFSVRIRGANSITAGNEPLYVIDGLPGAPANALNPGDIESIEILKDASATAIYGSRGANGVVMITTKKGRPGDIAVSYSGYYGVQEVANRLDLLDAGEYSSFLNGIQEDQGLPPLFSSEEIARAGNGTAWQDEIFRTAVIQNHQFSVSGGSQNTSYYVSLNHFNEDGVLINTGFDRSSARVNIEHNTDKFNFGINLNTSLVNNQDVPYGGLNADAGVIPAALQMDPLTPVFNENGAYSENSDLDLDNPVAQAETIFYNTETNRTFGNVFAEYFIVDELSAKVNFGSDRGISRSDNYITNVTRRGQSTNGQADIIASESTSTLLDLTLNYKDTIGEDHQISAVAGYSYQEFNNRGFNAGSQNFPTDAFFTDNLGAGDQERYSVGSDRSKNQLLSYLGRINYNWLNKYLVTASFRIDGSSRFGEDKKYGYFPSLALGWKIEEEQFLKDFEDLSTLKLRTSYGVTGNQAIGNYNSLVLLGSAGTAVFNDQQFAAIAPTQLNNPD